MSINKTFSVSLLFAACSILSCNKKNEDKNTAPQIYTGITTVVKQGALEPTTPYHKTYSSFAETLTVQIVGDSIQFTFADHTTFTREERFLHSAGNSYQAYSGSHNHWSYSFPTADSVVYTYWIYSGIDAGHFSQTDITFKGRRR